MQEPVQYLAISYAEILTMKAIEVLIFLYRYFHRKANGTILDCM